MAKRGQKRQESKLEQVESPSLGEIKTRRKELSNLRMATSVVGEGYYALKNVLDHTVNWSERAFYGEKYLPHKLKEYRGQKKIAFLLHGYLQGRSAFERLGRFLESDLFEIFTISLRGQPYSQDIRKTAEEEWDTIKYVLDHTDAEDVYLLGHSQGGLGARYMVQKLGGDSRVHRVITLSTPNQGTYAAAAGAFHRVFTATRGLMPGMTPVEGESGLQMIPGSGFLEELNAAPLPASVKWTSIYNQFDPLVWPPEYARLPYPEATNIRMRKIGHLHALYNEQVFEIILKSLLLKHPKGERIDTRKLVGRDVLERKRASRKGRDYDEIITSSD